MIMPLRNSINITVDIFDLLLTSTQAAIAENTEIVANDPIVIIVDENTLDEYLIVGLLQIVLTFSNNCDHLSGSASGSIIISSDAFAEFMMTIKNGACYLIAAIINLYYLGMKDLDTRQQ